jgi:hypothetical protein
MIAMAKDWDYVAPAAIPWVIVFILVVILVWKKTQPPKQGK